MSLPSISPKAKGVSLLFSNDYANSSGSLSGTHTDTKKLREFFKKHNYAVFKFKNLTKEQFIAKLKKFSKYHYPESCTSVVVYFSGHGSDGTLWSQNYEPVIIDHIITMFKPLDAANPTLEKTVRMFFFDACRSKRGDSCYAVKNGKAVRSSSNPINSQTSNNTAANDANILVAYSCTRYHLSYEYNTGSIWTSYLVEKLDNSQDHVLDILLDVNARMEHETQDKWTQTCEVHHTLTKKVYFKKAESNYPGINTNLLLY